MKVMRALEAVGWLGSSGYQTITIKTKEKRAKAAKKSVRGQAFAKERK